MQILRTILTFCWLVLFTGISIGIPLHSHYCGDMLYASGPVQTGCCCDTEEDSNCCRNESSYFSIDSDYIVSTALIWKVTPALAAEIHLGWIAPEARLSFASDQQPDIPHFQPPPKVPRRILQHQFTIYG